MEQDTTTGTQKPPPHVPPSTWLYPTPEAALPLPSLYPESFCTSSRYRPCFHPPSQWMRLAALKGDIDGFKGVNTVSVRMIHSGVALRRYRSGCADIRSQKGLSLSVFCWHPASCTQPRRTLSWYDRNLPKRQFEEEVSYSAYWLDPWHTFQSPFLRQFQEISFEGSKRWWKSNPWNQSLAHYCFIVPWSHFLALSCKAASLGDMKICVSPTLGRKNVKFMPFSLLRNIWNEEWALLFFAETPWSHL